MALGYRFVPPIGVGMYDCVCHGHGKLAKRPDVEKGGQEEVPREREREIELWICDAIPATQIFS